jgi:hypothetical protein
MGHITTPAAPCWQAKVQTVLRKRKKKANFANGKTRRNGEMNERKSIGAHVVGIVTVLCWGGTFINTKYLILGGLQPQEIFLLRFLIAYACIWFISPKRLFSNTWKDEALMALLGITGGSLYFLAENMAVGISYVTNVSFIVCTAPLLTTCMAIAMVKSVKADPRLIAGSLIALAGVGVVIFNGHFVLHLNPLGDLLALAAAVAWAIYSLLMKRASARYGAVFITRKVFFYGLLTILPVFVFKPWTFPLGDFLRLDIWTNLLFLGFVASFVCFVLWSWVIRKIGAMKASNYIYLNPVTTVIAGALFLNEPMTLMAYIGSALILFGVYIANQAKGI